MTYFALTIPVLKQIQSVCDTDAQIGKTLYAMAAYFFTESDCFELTGRAKGAYEGQKDFLDTKRARQIRGKIDGPKGGNPNLIKGKQAGNAAQTTDEPPADAQQMHDKCTENVPAEYTGESHETGVSPADMDEYLG